MLIQFDNSGIAIGVHKAYGFSLVYGEFEEAVVVPEPELPPSASWYGVPRELGRKPVIHGRGLVTIEGPDVFGTGHLYNDYTQALREDEDFMAAMLL